MRFLALAALWFAATFAFLFALMMGGLALFGSGEWAGFRLIVRLVYIGDFAICTALLAVALSTPDVRRRVAALVAAAASAPLTLSFALWANR